MNPKYVALKRAAEVDLSRSFAGMAALMPSTAEVVAGHVLELSNGIQSLLVDIERLESKSTVKPNLCSCGHSNDEHYESCLVCDVRGREHGWSERG